MKTRRSIYGPKKAYKHEIIDSITRDVLFFLQRERERGRERECVCLGYVQFSSRNSENRQVVDTALIIARLYVKFDTSKVFVFNVIKLLFAALALTVAP